METYRKFNLKGRVIPVLGSTTYMMDVFSNMDAKFCFIDGDHSYEGTRSDLVFCGRHLTRKGYMVVHDYPRAGTVKRAVDEFIKDHCYTLLEVCGDGVVALQKGNLL